MIYYLDNYYIYKRNFNKIKIYKNHNNIIIGDYKGFILLD